LSVILGIKNGWGDTVHGRYGKRKVKRVGGLAGLDLVLVLVLDLVIGSVQAYVLRAQKFGSFEHYTILVMSRI